jgi:hypothetical protein
MTDEDTNLSIQLTGHDIESTISFEITLDPEHGKLSGNAPDLIYTPDENYNGSDNFRFVTFDGEDYSEEANISINILPINDTPIALEQNLTLKEDTTVSIQLKASDVDGDALNFKLSTPSNGTLTGIAPNITYKPNENFHGSDSFTFTVSDDAEANATATIMLSIEDVNDIPTVSVGVTIQGEEVTLSATATDIDGEIVSYEWREDATILSKKASFSKNDFSQGAHTFTFTAIDDDGDSASASLDVTITTDSSTSTLFQPYNLQIGSGNDEIKWQRFADMDDDGDDDIVFIAQSGLHWYENSGDLSSFVAHKNISTLPSIEDVQLVDIDGDSKLDIIFSTSTTSPNLHICTNDSNQAFTCRDILTSFSSLSMIQVADMDNDNDIDIILSSNDTSTISWIENSSGSFNKEYIISTTDMPNVISLDIADFNQDGRVDIIAASNRDNTIYWFENQGTGFVSHLQDNSISNITTISLSDIDGDNILDSIVTSATTNTTLSWFKGTGTTTPSPTFTAPKFISTDISNINYATGIDMDSDGDIDILTHDSGEYGKIIWYENIGQDSNFTEHSVASNTNRVVRVFANDLDKDGDIDIIAGDINGNITIYENQRPLTTTAIPKTGDMSDGEYGGDYNFSRDNTLEVVSDSLTGLMWQDDSATTKNAKKWDSLDLENDCNINLGNFSDWRFPNRHELYYLAEKGGTALDGSFQNISSFVKDYWTSSKNQIYVNFSSVYDKVARSINYTRCVRGEPITFDFIRDDSKEVVLDKKHQLMWEDGSASDQKTASTWDDAISSCATLDYLGFSDWRLPNINELYAIFNDDGLDKAFVARGNSSDILISSTTYNASQDKAYGVNATNGLDEQLSKNSSLKYRCVRNIAN